MFCLQGKRLFSEGDVSGALAQNSVAIEYVDDELLFQLEGFHLEQAQAVRAPLHLNVAACHLALDQWQSAADAATAALAVTAPDNKELFAKALFRRARARKQLRQTEQAINDLEQALKRCGAHGYAHDNLINCAPPKLKTCAHGV